MRFLGLAAHLLPVLALGGLLSGEEISTEGLHRSYNDEVYDLSEELSGNNHSNPGHYTLCPTESQSATISPVPTTAGQPLLSSALVEKELDRNVGAKIILTTKRTDNFNGVTTKQFCNETGRSVSDGTIEATENYSRTPDSLLVMSTSFNITHNQQRQADLGTAITANDRGLKGEENFIPEDDVALADLNGEPESGGRKMNPDVQSAVETIIDPISNTEAPVKSNSVSSKDDISAYNEPIYNQNSKPAEAVESDSKLSEEVFEQSADTVATQLPEYNSSRDQYFEIMNDGYASHDRKRDEGKENETSADTISEKNWRRGTTENWSSVSQSIIPSEKERLDFNEKMLQSIQNTVSNSNVNHNVMNNSPTVPCSCSTPPASSNLYPSPHSLSPSIPVPESPPGVPIESDLPEEYSGFEIEPKSRYIDYDDVGEQNLRGFSQFLHPLLGRGAEPVEKNDTPIIQVKGDVAIHGESLPMRLARKCRKILVTRKSTCRRGKPICYSPCNGCQPLCEPGRIICSGDPSQGPRIKLVCKVIWRPVSWPGIIIYPAESYEASYYELFNEQLGLLRESKQDLSALESDGCDHGISRLQISPTAASFKQLLEPLSEPKDTGSEEDQDSAVSQQLFVELIPEAINRSPEILPAKLIADVVPETVQELEAIPLDSHVKILNPFENPIKPKALGNRQSRKGDDEIDKLFVVQPEVLPGPAIKEETTRYNTARMANVNANERVNTNVNLNRKVNFNGNIAAGQPLLPDIQVPITSPVIGPLIYPEPGIDNGNLNTNANGHMNLNIDQNHNGNLGHKKRLPVQPIVEPESVKATETPQVEPTIPVFEEQISQNTNVNINSNTNLNHNLNEQIGVPGQPKTEVPTGVSPKIQQPTVPKIPFEVVLEPANHLEQNSSSNVNINYNNNVNGDVLIPETPETVIDKNPVVLSDTILPWMENENQNANVNFNVNSNVDKDVNENREPVVSKITQHNPIAIPEPVQVAEPLVKVSVPIYEMPVLPALPSTLDFNSNVNQNLNSNVNLNIINQSNNNVIQREQQPLTEPINQPTPAPTFPPTEATPKLILAPEVADSTIRANQNVQHNLNSNLNVNSNQNVNQDIANQASQEAPETFPVSLEPGPIENALNVPVVNENANEYFNMNQDFNRNVNPNSNVNMNSNYNADVNVLETPSSGSPVIIPGPRPVASVPEFALSEVTPVAPVSSQVSQNHIVSSNTIVDYNSNMNNDVNHKIAVPSKELVSPVIKPVESQPVAGPKHSEILPLTPSQIHVNQNLKGNANVNNNVNVNMNVNANHNVNGNADYKTGEKEILELPKIKKKPVMGSGFSDRVVTEAPGPEQVAILRPDENEELNNNQNVNSDANYNSNVNFDHNFILNENGNIRRQRITPMPVPVPTTVLIQEPNLLPSRAQAPIIFHAPIVESVIREKGKSNADYNANVNINHNLNSNANYNQGTRIRGQVPILFPPLPSSTWTQELQPQIIPDVGMNLIHNSDVNLDRNSNANVNYNVNSNDNHNIVSREPNALLATYEYSNKNDYAPILKHGVGEPIETAAPTLAPEEEETSIPHLARDSQVNVNQNANVNMNYNSNYNNNANFNGKGVVSENENGKLPLIKPPQNVLAHLIVPQSQKDRGTGLWNVQKNFNVNANYNSNVNYNSNLGRSRLGILAQDGSDTRENSSEIRGPIFTGHAALSAPIIPNIVIGGNLNSGQFGYGAERNVNTDANFNSNSTSESNYTANFNQDADYNAQLTVHPKNSETKGWYELRYNNGKDKNGWTEIWNNKQFKKLFEQRLKELKHREDEQLARVQAQALALIR